MIIQKFILVPIVLFALLLNSAPDEQRKSDDKLSIYELSFLINNSPLNTVTIPGNITGSENAYLNALLKKKEGKFNEIYNELKAQLTTSPEFYPFYDELIYASSITKQESLLESFFLEKDVNPNIRYYVNALFAEARGEYAVAIKQLLNIDPADLTYRLKFKLANLYKDVGDYAAAGDLLNQITTDTESDPLLEAEILLLRGNLYFFAGEYIAAEKLYKKGSLTAKKTNDKRSEIRSLINLAIIDDINGDIDSAREKFIIAIDLASFIGDINLRATALSELGVSYSYTNNLLEAKKYYEESFFFFGQLNNRNRLALLSENLGKIFTAMSDHKTAIKYFETGLQFAGESKRAQVLNLRALADVYANLSNYSKALRYYKEAEEVAAGINDINLNSELKSSLGILHYNLKLYDNASKYFNDAEVSAGEQGNHFLKADIYHKMGLVYFDKGELIKGEEFFKKALSEADKGDDDYTKALTYSSLSALYLKMKNHSSAIETAAIGEKISSGNGWVYLEGEFTLLKGLIADQLNEFESAKNYFRQAYLKGKEVKDFNLAIEALYRSAKLFERYNLNELAELNFKEAISLNEDITLNLFSDQELQISYFATSYEIYSSFAAFYLEQEDYRKAYDVIELSRAKNMYGNLRDIKLREMVEDQELIDKLYEYSWAASSGVYDEIDYRGKIELIKKELAAKNRDISKYLNNEQGTGIEEVISNLGSEYILSFFTTEDNTFIFRLSKDGFTGEKLNYSRRELLIDIEALSPYYGENNEHFYNQDLFSFNSNAAYKLFSRLLEPAMRDIPENAKVIIIPSAEITSVPLEFLVTKEEPSLSAYNYKGQKFLLYDYNISYSPSVSVYIGQKETGVINNGSILLVGDPAIDNKMNGYAERRGLLEETGGIPRNISLLPLKYSIEEITRISEITGADKVLSASEATESNFKKNAGDSRIIHLSTHSFLFNKQPVIFFSNFYDPDNDGFLELGEIAELKLNSEMVVLSSCNSGLGIVDKSEGIIGMTKAFIEAGAKSVVVSLWEVNDKYTARFMELFYNHLGNGEEKSEALRKAKIEFIEKYSANPYYWGAFVLTGNNDPIALKGTSKYSSYLYSLMVLILLGSSFVYIRRRKHF